MHGGEGAKENMIKDYNAYSYVAAHAFKKCANEK